MLIGWDPIANAASYEIQMKDSAEWFGGADINPEILQTKWPSNSYLVNILKPGVLYHFRVRANNGCGTGPWSTNLELTSIPSTPSTPVIRQSGKNLILFWDDPYAD